METMREASTEEELGVILKMKPDKILITGDLVSNVKTIKKPGKVVWWGIAGALVTILTMVTGPCAFIALTAIGPVLAIAGGVGAVVVGVLGTQGTLSAIKIGKAGGGIEVLNTLRAYKILEEDNDSKHSRLIVGR